MKQKNKYIQIWEDVLPKILSRLKEGNQNADIDMSEDEFVAVGNRKSYGFRLQTDNGEVTNNIGGSAVARDLYGVLSANPSFMELAEGRRIVFTMGVKFKLRIENKKL